jgi:hypothetical protein
MSRDSEKSLPRTATSDLEPVLSCWILFPRMARGVLVVR